MPNYEYQCTACDNLFEIWQPVGEVAPACPKCGAVVKKVFHPPRVIFKGSGFYVTDLRAEKAGNAASKTKAKTSEAASEAASSEATSNAADSTEAAKETRDAPTKTDSAKPAEKSAATSSGAIPKTDASSAN